MPPKIRLRSVPGLYSVARLAPDALLPDWAQGANLLAMVRARDELTIVCDAQHIPPEVTQDGPWVCWRSIGPFDFQETGILHALVSPISDAGIGVFVLCTFDGEHILVPQADAERAAQALNQAGHQFECEQAESQTDDTD